MKKDTFIDFYIKLRAEIILSIETARGELGGREERKKHHAGDGRLGRNRTTTTTKYSTEN